MVEKNELRSLLRDSGYEFEEPMVGLPSYTGGDYQKLSQYLQLNHGTAIPVCTEDDEFDGERYQKLTANELENYDSIYPVGEKLRFAEVPQRGTAKRITALTDAQAHHHRQTISGLLDQVESGDNLAERVVELRTSWELDALELSRDDLLALDAARKSLFSAQQAVKGIVDPIRIRRELPIKGRSRDIER